MLSSSRQIHPFEPVISENSKILILGSFPSVKSREMLFYYGHPRNRFWTMLASVFGCAVPVTIEEKKALIIENGLALWDTLQSCDIHASADASIKKEIPNDIAGLVEKYNIKAIIFNGNASYKYYQKYFKNNEKLKCVVKMPLPSTSPANAAVRLDELVPVWKAAIDDIIWKGIKTDEDSWNNRRI